MWNEDFIEVKVLNKTVSINIFNFKTTLLSFDFFWKAPLLKTNVPGK